MSDPQRPELLPELERCATAYCGAGQLDLGELLQRAANEIKRLAALPPTPTPGMERSCLHCEGHGVVRHYLNRAGEFDKSHCPICGGTGKEKHAPLAPHRRSLT
jgi:hypothetical protein